MSEKQSFVNLKSKEIKKAEATLYYIQTGNKLFEYEGQCLWERDEAEEMFTTLQSGLEHMLSSGDEREKADAMEILVNFRILPLRFA